MIMDPFERDDRVMSLAAEALKTPPPQRERFLQAACQNDPQLYREVSEVVTWEERMEGFLSRPLVEFVYLETLEDIFKEGQVVSGRFEIVRYVGEGGMGVVYEAHDRLRNQRIAIKCAKPGFGRQLPPELEGALKVRHPNVCLVNEIHSTATDFGQLSFLTMEFLDGETLRQRLKLGKIGGADALEIARQLCAGLAEAHRVGVLHRDLKPGNIILAGTGNGGTKAVITDFGLATDESAVAVAGGTPTYMAPELAGGGKASQASDVFSLGVILYEMVTGQKPFAPGDENNADSAPPVPPSRLVKGLSRNWDRAILPCLSPQTGDRSSPGEVMAALAVKSWYRTPAAMLAAAALLLFLVFLPQIVSYFKSRPPYSLAVLPVEAPGDLAPRGNQLLSNAAARLKKIQEGKPTLAVIPISKALQQGVTTPDKAAEVLGATHALELKLNPESDGVTAEWAIIDLKTKAHIRDYSSYFSGSALADLPAGLTGSVALALHLHRSPKTAALSQPALPSYDKGLAYLELESRDFTHAIKEFQEAARLDPHSPLPLAGLAAAHVREYQALKKDSALNEARAWLARAEALDADSPEVRLASGLLHQVAGDSAKAREDYQRVEEIDKKNVEALLGLGFSYELQGLLDKAVSYYDRAIQAAPGNYKPYQYLGALYFYHGRSAEAEGPFRKEIQCAPDRMDGYSNLAGAYIAQGKYREAEELSASLPKGAETASWLNNIGAKLAFQSKDTEAIYYYNKAIEQNPNRTIYWLNLGDSQRRMGKLAQARKAYQQGIALARTDVTTNPGSASARGYLAYLQARLGLKQQAGSEIAAALNAPTADDQVNICAVQTYEILGDRQRALAALAKTTAQSRKVMLRHPDLADLRRDSRFIVVMGQSH